jgi:calcium permeable stress-gated cation channel
MLGHFVHKYQLLYAMDHRQHSTGRGWVMICDRVIIGIILFQLTTAGQLALLRAYNLAAAIVPLLLMTLWFSIAYSRTYRPLMKYIALRSLRDPGHTSLGRRATLDEQSEVFSRFMANSGDEDEFQTVDEVRERGLRFINPSLIMP